MPRSIPFAQYLFRRLKQFNCHSIHGVPGDFFLRALDHIQPAGLKWIGNANELCAGYAADGYARAASQMVNGRDTSEPLPPRSVGAFMTTYGVGELSAINALAGAFAESIPVIQVVGTPSRKAMLNNNQNKLVHHTLPDASMETYFRMVEPVVCRQVHLHQAQSAELAAEAFDEALLAATSQSKPAYVALPSDMIDLPVSPEPLEEQIQQPGQPFNKSTVKEILDRLKRAKNPLIIADGLSYPFGWRNWINELITLTQIPAMSFTSGKGIVEESLPSWSPALPNTTEYSRNCDLAVIFGPILSDTNTARWSAVPETENKILFNLDSVQASPRPISAGNVNPDDHGSSVLAELVTTIRSDKDLQASLWRNPVQNNVAVPLMRLPPASTVAIAQDDLWPALSTYLRPEDTILLANGTPLIGGRALHLPTGCKVVASPIWNAIGSMLPAAQGIAAAKRDHRLPGRTILFEGDGSFQVTCQSLSDIIRYKLDVTVFIINNAGYTYERWLNGMEAEYNDVPAWRYTEAASFFGARDHDRSYPLYSERVETWGQLMGVLQDDKANDGKGLKIIDVVMDPQDVPEGAKPGLKRASDALKAP